MTVITGTVPNFPWWRAMAMTDEEIKQYNSKFLISRTVEYDDEEIQWSYSDRKSTLDSLAEWMKEKLC